MHPINGVSYDSTYIGELSCADTIIGIPGVIKDSITVQFKAVLSEYPESKPKFTRRKAKLKPTAPMMCRG